MPVTSRRTRRSRTSADGGSCTADRLRLAPPSTRSAGALCNWLPGELSRSWTACGRPAPSESASAVLWTPSWRCVFGLARERWPPGEVVLQAVLSALQRCRSSLLDRRQQFRRYKHLLGLTESLDRWPTFVSSRQCRWLPDDNRWMSTWRPAPLHTQHLL